MPNPIIYVLGVIVVVAAILLEFGSSAGMQSAPNGTTAVAFQLTDPPYVPSGTSALIATYSSLQLYVSNSTGSGWINVAGSGTVDLMSLTNVSETIGRAYVATNSMVTSARFNITSASITVNGTSYPVLLPQSRLTANLTSDNKVNATSSVLFDLSPTVAVIYTNNSTVFVMVPSVRAVLVPGISGMTYIGTRTDLGSGEKHDLDDVRPNISITGATITQNDNIAHVSVTVKDNSNQSVKIRNLAVAGPEWTVIRSGGCGGPVGDVRWQWTLELEQLQR